MFRYPGCRLAAVASVLAVILGSAGLAGGLATPAAAQAEESVSFGYFQDRLSRFGQWSYDDRWGDVWRPPHAHSFRPYYDGHWEYTDDYGWLWVSDEPWADITYHYGRWVYDPEEGWLWIPGYVWAPAWVIWREGDGYLGWFPMPPDYGDFDDGPYFGGHYDWDDCYGYRTWYGMDRDTFFGLWIFVDHEHFYRRDYRNFAIGRPAIRDIIHRTSDSTHYAMSGNHIVNRSVPIDRIEQAVHHRIERAPARQFLHGDVPITAPSTGRDIARQEHGGGPGHHFRENEGGAGDHQRRLDNDHHHQPPGSAPFEQKPAPLGGQGGPPQTHDHQGGERHFEHEHSDSHTHNGEDSTRYRQFENQFQPPSPPPSPPSGAPNGGVPHAFDRPPPQPDRMLHAQPHENSGGQEQGHGPAPGGHHGQERTGGGNGAEHHQRQGQQGQ